MLNSGFRTLLFLGLLLGLSSLGAGASEVMQPIEEIFEPAASYDSAKFGKVAVVQWNGSQPTPIGVTVEEAEAFKMANRQALEVYVREAAAHGAEWVITPEFSIVGYPEIPELPPEESDFRNREDIRPYVETVPGPSTVYFSGIAKELHLYIHIALAEVEPATGEYFNTVVALDPNGKIVAKYRKMNLYQLENDFLSAGSEMTVYRSPFGKVGIIICADVFSSSPMDQYRAARVDVLALSTSWAAMNSGMDAFQAGARSVHAYVLAANQHYFPDSGVIEPDGAIQSHIRQSMGIAYGFLPRARASRFR